MTGVIRQHVLSVNDALDRRKVTELFLEMAKRLSAIDGHAIRGTQLRRGNFKIDAWEEYQSDLDWGINFLTPEMGYVVPATSYDFVLDDSYVEANVTWSIQATPGDEQASNMLMAIPVVDGVGVYGAEDWLEVDQLLNYDVLTAFGNAAIDPTEQNYVGGVSFQDAVADDAYSWALDAGTTFSLSGGDNVDGVMSLGNSGHVVALNGRSRVGIVVFSIGKFKVTKATMLLRKVLR